MTIQEDKLKELVDLTLQGRLTQGDFSRLTGCSGVDFDFTFNLEGFALRQPFTRTVSWCLPTVEYFDALAKMLKGKRVVEVCAGKGIFQAAMRQRGVEWISTDLEPGAPHVLKMDALEAVDTLNPDFVFASWIPYESDLDYQIAIKGVPCLFVTEGWGGCTGSENFWQEDGIKYMIASKVLDHDVLCWPGIHDHTILVLPGG